MMRLAESSRGTLAAVALVAAFVLFGALVSGCSGSATQGGQTQAGQTQTQTQTPSSSGLGRAPAPSAVAPINLKTPESAVRSYSARISDAYRVLDSDIATPVATPQENVRIDSYVELNRQKNQAIDQKLVSVTLKTTNVGAKTATVTGKETWNYRYLDAKTQAYISGPLTAVYKTTYTLKRSPAGLWQVAEVKAVPQGQVK